MLQNPLLEAMLAPLARRETWEYELRKDGVCFAKRNADEIKSEYHSDNIGGIVVVGDVEVVRIK